MFKTKLIIEFVLQTIDTNSEDGPGKSNLNQTKSSIFQLLTWVIFS